VSGHPVVAATQLASDVNTELSATGGGTVW